ncbi:MAG: EAL domain-containing protein [Eggerthellaceae bacterium]|nr:EAL domain-containing protein [Eggerthellaceae bacterium]
MPGESKGSAGEIHELDLRQIMAAMHEACDVVRVVDPSTYAARTLADDGSFNEPYACYTALCHDRRCENCISMRAVEEQRPVSKFEFVDSDIYFITARPITSEGKNLSIEMVQKVSDEVGMHDGAEEIFEHIQEETDHEFIDGFTGTYTRSYFDNGLEAMQGRKLAMVKIENLARINEEEGYPAGDLVLKRIAHEILANTDIADSVIHYAGSKFVVQFEDMDSEKFPAILERIADAVNAVVIENHPHLHPAATVVAVDEDATYGQLAEHARALLAQAEEKGERLLIHSSDEHHHVASSHARAAAAGETLHHAPDKLIADVDELTGLHTSSYIRMHLQHVIEERHHHEDGYCVIYLDIVNFKQFNRTYGRTGGDMLLRFLADKIRGEFPAGEIAHIAGDVFVGVTHEGDIRARIERLRQQVANYQKKITLELKAGVNKLDEAAHDAAAAIDLAKVACESIKTHYDLGIRFYDSVLDQEISMNEYVVNNIEHAIEEGRIRVFYQPIIRTMTERVCGYECLCRWDDPMHGILPPAAFVEALERFHMIDKLDTYVVRQACAHQAALLAAGKPLVPVSVNLSRLDFQLCDIFAAVEAAVADAGIPRNMLSIEVTESALDDGAGEVAVQIERFREAGYEVWMDDFGSGYSSLNLLKDYRFDTLKIDMAFLAGFEDNPKSREIIVTVVDMAKKLGIRTLIEGVETKRQYRFLQRIGCEMLQGFFFGEPLPYSEDMFPELEVEDARERAYFDELGSVNLLGLPTGEATDAVAGYVTESESRSTPMALVEYRGGAYSYLSANEAYLKLLEGIDVRTLDDLQEVMSSGGYSIPAGLVVQLDETRRSGIETTRERTMNGEPHHVHVRHIATGPDAHAFVVVLVALS